MTVVRIDQMLVPKEGSATQTMVFVVEKVNEVIEEFNKLAERVERIAVTNELWDGS